MANLLPETSFVLVLRVFANRTNAILLLNLLFFTIPFIRVLVGPLIGSCDNAVFLFKDDPFIRVLMGPLILPLFAIFTNAILLFNLGVLIEDLMLLRMPPPLRLPPPLDPPPLAPPPPFASTSGTEMNIINPIVARKRTIRKQFLFLILLWHLFLVLDTEFLQSVIISFETFKVTLISFL